MNDACSFKPGSTDYSPLVSSRDRIDSSTTVEATLIHCKSRGVDSIGVTHTGELVGLWSHLQTAEILGTQFGYSLHAKQPIAKLIIRDPLILRNGERMEPFLARAMSRPQARFQEPVVLLDTDGSYLGLIAVKTLANLQSHLLLERMAELEKSNRTLLQAMEVAEESTRAKSAFLSTISHELLTPMNGILGSLEVLRETQLDSEQREFTSLLGCSASRLLRSLTDVLTFTQLESSQFQAKATPCQLPQLVRSVGEQLRPVASAKGIGLRTQIPDAALPQVMTDHGHLSYVLQHLHENALKFSLTGEIVTRLLILSQSEDSLSARIEVSDQGIGIPPERQKLIFAPFTQGDSTHRRRHEGLGMGLVISQQILQHLGGRLEFESEKDRGSKFWFDLQFPLAPRQP